MIDLRKKLLVIVCSLVLTNASAAPSVLENNSFDQFNPSSIATDAPQELMHFGQIIGKWNIDLESLSPDGTTWTNGPSAQWNFYWIMEGHAIQDDWIVSTTKADGKTNLFYGTNIRTYNRKADKWNIAWLDSRGSDVLEITAKSTKDEIVMSVVGKNPQGFYRRIVFFKMTDRSFDWKQLWSKNGESNWFEVSRIHGTRVEH